MTSIVWAGRMSRDQVELHYQRSDVVIFPSRLETWGLPITEAKALCKPLLLADLPYAHETLGDYSAACFFEPNDAHQLADKIINIIDGERLFGSVHDTPENADAFLDSWEELVNKMLDNSAKPRVLV